MVGFRVEATALQTRKKPTLRLGLSALALVLAGCGNFVASSGIYYNAGLSDASNSVLLANIVRAAKGYPTYYSVVGDYSASRATNVGFGIHADLSPEGAPGSDLGISDVGVIIGPSENINRNTNSSSLETQDFIRAMHTRITPEMFALLVENSSLADVNLKLALLMESVSITRDEYANVIAGAQQTCHTRERQAVCATFAETVASAQCGESGPTNPDGKTIVRLRNDPTNPCDYYRFRTFIEAFMLNRPHLEQDVAGNTVLIMGSGSAGLRLFQEKGTGFFLRSPGGAVGYLGQIVREAYRTGWTPRLMTSEGTSVPIFVVNRSPQRSQAAVAARIDGQDYWIARQELGAAQADFSNSVLALVKDLQALNTLHDQLPKNSSILIGP